MIFFASLAAAILLGVGAAFYVIRSTLAQLGGEPAYTMAQERAVHAGFAPAASAVADVPVVSAHTVDDDDALF